MKQIILLIFIGLLYANDSCIENYKLTDNYDNNKTTYKVNFITSYGADKYAQYQIKVLKTLWGKKIDNKYIKGYILNTNKQPIIGNKYIVIMRANSIVSSLYSCKNNKFLFKEKKPDINSYIKSLNYLKK